MKTINEVILKILEAIEYANDRQAFVKEFMKNVSLQAFVDLAQTMPQERQEELKKEFVVAGEDVQKISDVVKKYFSEEQFNCALENAAKNAVTEWLKAIDSALSDPQRQKLVNLSKQFVAPSVS